MTADPFCFCAASSAFDWIALTPIRPEVHQHAPSIGIHTKQKTQGLFPMSHDFLLHCLFLLLPKCPILLAIRLVCLFERFARQVDFDVEQYCAACRQTWGAVNDVAGERD